MNQEPTISTPGIVSHLFDLSEGFDEKELNQKVGQTVVVLLSMGNRVMAFQAADAIIVQGWPYDVASKAPRSHGEAE